MSSKIPGRSKKDKNRFPKPYERPTGNGSGIVQKVKDLIPNWLSLPSWLISATSSNASTSDPAQVRAESVSPTRHDLEQPGPSGLHLMPSFISHPTEESGVSTRLQPVDVSYAREPLRKTNEPLLQVNGDDQSENSETSASTSGCSSLAPSHQEKKKQCTLKGMPVSVESIRQLRSEANRGSNGEALERPNQALRTRGVREPFQESSRPVLEPPDEDTDLEQGGTPSTRTSLWSEDEYLHNSLFLSSREHSNRATPSPSSRPQPLGPSRRPAFSLSAFGVPISDTSRQAFSGLTLSPFYQGPTAFGGASAYRRSRMASPYNNLSRTPVNVRKGSNQEPIMSATAKKILQSIETMSSPLADAKRIPTADCLLSYTPASFRAKRARHLATGETPGPPMRNIQIPEKAVVIRNTTSSYQIIDKRPSKALPQVPPGTPSQNQTDSPLRWHEYYRSYCDLLLNTKSEAPSIDRERKAGGKMRASTSSVKHYKAQEEQEELEEMNLPDIQLNITSLPKFGFGALEKPSSAIQQPPGSSCSENEGPGTCPYAFSQPILPAQPGQMSPSLSHLPEKPLFQFSSPLSLSKESGILKPPLRKMETQKALTSASSGLLLGCSVMDILGKKDEDKVKCSDGFGKAPLHPSSGKTEAETLSAKPFVEASKVETSAGFGNLFKPAVGSWSCPVCMVVNKASQSICLACETPNPKAQPRVTLPQEPTSTPAAPSSNFKGFYQPPSQGSWECEICMVVNVNPGKRDCVACGTQRFPSIKPTDQAPKYVFGASANKTDFVPASFKFGVPATPAFSLGGSQPPSEGFTFGVYDDQAKKVPVTTASIAEFAPLASVGGFSFGSAQPMPAPQSSVPSFKFGVPAAKPADLLNIGVSKSSSTTASKLDNQGDTNSIFSSQKLTGFNKSVTFGQTQEDRKPLPDKTVPLAASTVEKGLPLPTDLNAAPVPKTISEAPKPLNDGLSIVSSEMLVNTETIPPTSEVGGGAGFKFSMTEPKVAEVSTFGGFAQNPPKNLFSFGENSLGKVKEASGTSQSSSIVEVNPVGLTLVSTSTLTTLPKPVGYFFGTANSVTSTTSLGETKSTTTPQMSVSSGSSGSSLFSFGATPVASQPPPALGSQPAATTTTNSFSFRPTPLSSAAPSSTATSTSSALGAGSFVFGGPTALAKPTPAMVTNTGQKGFGFSFSSVPTAVEVPAPGSSSQPVFGSQAAFNFGAPQPQAASSEGSNPRPPFVFGPSALNPPQQQQQPQNIFGGFGTGSAPPARLSTTPSFQFGPPASSASGVFQFGGGTTQNNINSSQTTGECFNFNPVANSGTSGGFSFPNPSQPPAQFSAENPFNVTGNSGTTRVIRKAVRRVAKPGKNP